MKHCSIYNIKDLLIIVTDDKVKAGYWESANDVETVKINERFEVVNSLIFKQLEKTIIGIPTPSGFDDKNKIQFWNKLGYKGWISFFNKCYKISISIKYEKNKYNINFWEKSIEYKYSYGPCNEFEDIILNEDESHKIAGIVIDIFRKGMEE